MGYAFVYLDTTCSLKRETVMKEAVYIAIGIREDGTKEVITYKIAPTEFRKNLLVDIKERWGGDEASHELVEMFNQQDS